MQNKDKINRIKELVKLINQYSYEYYTLDNPTISDLEWDRLYDELRELENNTGFVLSNSPTVKVGYKVLEGMEKIKHEYKLASLDKCKSTETKKLINFTNLAKSIAMLKLDGLTCDLTYEDGYLVSGATRGDGIEGDLITDNAKTFTNIPTRIPYTGKVHIVGEAIMTYDVFDEIRSKYDPSDKERPKHPRNLASGSLKLLDSSVCATRKLKFIGYIVQGIDFDTKIEQLEFIDEQGFEVVDYIEVSRGENIDSITEKIEKLREKAEYRLQPIDGIVFMYNDLALGKSLGNTSKFPLHSLAYKFEDEVEITILTNVEWQMGTKNNLTPVGIFNSVELDGTSVSRATLSNISEIERLELGLGDHIGVRKANKIIPQITHNVTKSNNLEIPTICPNCGAKTEIVMSKSGIKTLSCTNKNCSLVSRIDRYGSKAGMNIKGLSKSTIEVLIENNIITDIVDLYKLKDKREQLLALPRFGAKKVDNLLGAIEKSKVCKLNKFLFALSIDNVGESTARNMVEFIKEEDPYKAINKMRRTTINEWVDMKDSGDVLSDSLYNFFSDVDKQIEVDRIIENLKFETEEVIEVTNTDNPLNGKKVYLTGSFKIDSKANLKKKLQSMGVTIGSGYAKSLGYLIYANDLGVSGKVEKAKTDGVPIMSEDELNKILGGEL